MHKWEYLTLVSTRNYGTTKYYINGEQQPNMRDAKFPVVLNQFGAQGWEMIGLTVEGSEKTYIFKRMASLAAANGNASRPARIQSLANGQPG